MCGIAGYYLKQGVFTQGSQALAMIRTLRHRGPDDEGYTFIHRATGGVLDCSGRESAPRIQQLLAAVDDKPSGFAHDIALAHRRFSIIDLSPAGHQPMWDREREICLTFNGEVYNHIELREELIRRGHAFQTRSDTEVILRAFREWGSDAFPRLNGPWALALYDKRRKALLLSRDRMGKAPLYYAVHGNCLYFASEIKAIHEACGRHAFPVRDQAVDDYLIHGWRDLDGTFWHGIDDFPPAHFAWVSQDLALHKDRYWDFPTERMPERQLSVADAVTGLGDRLADAVRIRLRADVPVAFELSGGMDSSSLVALSAARLDTRVSAYTVKFDEAGADEEAYARSVYERYPGMIDYHVVRPDKDDFWKQAGTFVHLQEEPFHAPNLLTLQSLRWAIRRNGIKVVLAGSAGDEVLAGYPDQYFSPFLLYLLKHGRLLRLAREAARSPEKGIVRTLGGVVRHMLPAGFSLASSEQRVLALTKGAYRQPAAVERRTGKSRQLLQLLADNMTAWMMNYWLRSGNKASFGIPIEPRSPFLDHHVVEFAFSLPCEYLIKDGWHKWILRQTTKQLLPPDIVWRRQKMGFPFPWQEWLLRSRDRAAANINDLDCPYLSGHAVMRSYELLLQRDPVLLWRLICLGLWWRIYVEGRPLSAVAGEPQ